MARLSLSVACGNYDRTRPLIDGEVAIDGVDPVVMALSPEEMFFRAFRHADFDISELSLSSFALRTARGDNPYVGIPVFLSRAFRHNAIYIRTDRGIDRPEDLRGRRIGIPEFQLTACVWARALLADDYGVGQEEIVWVRGGLEETGRIEKISLDIPGVRMEDAPADRTLSQLLAQGEIDGIMGPRAPSCYGTGAVGRLFPDPIAASADYYRRTGIFPIMHLVGIRRELVEAHPFLPVAVFKAFDEAKRRALAHLRDLSASKAMLPFLAEALEQADALMGADFWPYGVEENRATLEAFLRHHHAQGLSPRRVAVEELFHPAVIEAQFRI